MGKRALAVFTTFSQLLGITLKPDKADVGARVAFLGLQGYFPCRANDMKLQISLTGEKASICGSLDRLYPERGSTSAHELESLIC